MNRILRIDIEGFKVAEKRLPVSKPNWREGGPTQPAAIAAGSPGRATVRIALDPDAGAAPMGVLTGTLGTLRFSGRCQVVAGEQDVAVRIDGDPLGGFRRHAGDAEWSVLPDGAVAPLPIEPPTPLEVFELLGKPVKFYSGAMGVWAEALRFLAERVGVTGVADPRAAVTRIARFCHQGHGLRYNTEGGGSSFFPGVTRAVFKLSAFLRGGSPRLVNCYDQAGAVQALAGALGIAAEYCYLRPFGYIQVADIVGIGPCNNPFFADPGGNHPSQPIVNGTPRSFFDNHTFCRLDDRIYDACAGPHLGTHRPGAYLANLIDNTVQHVHGLPGGILSARGVWKVK